MPHHPIFSKALWFTRFLLFMCTLHVSPAMSETKAHSPQLGLSIQISADDEYGYRLVIMENQTELDLTANYHAALPCRFSEEPKVERIWSPLIHHQFFSARIRWRCGETVFEGRLGATIETARSSLNSQSKFDFHFHVFSVQSLHVSCQDALSPAEMR